MIVFVHIAIAVMLLILGYLVKYRRWSTLIAGYNTASEEEKVKYDEEALCSFVGNLMFVLAFILALRGFGYSILKPTLPQPLSSNRSYSPVSTKVLSSVEISVRRCFSSL